MGSEYSGSWTHEVQIFKECEHLARYRQERARCSHSKNVPHNCGNRYKYDEWAFYKNQFRKMWPEIKGVDLIAIHDGVIWLIEAKDYRQYSRTKKVELTEEVAKKVFCTLAAMLPAKLNASDSSERNFAAQVLRGQRLRVVLHLEQPVTHSRLFPRAIDPSKVHLKLRTLIKPIDPHPKVVESTQMQGLPWTVT